MTAIADLIIINGRIVDGCGNPWYWADVAIIADKISGIGHLRDQSAKRVINAQGMVVCPGFFDMHAHSDIVLLSQPRHEAKIMQGVTTDVIGQDGLSYAPVTTDALSFLRWNLAGLNGNPDNVSWDWQTVSEFLDQFDQRVAVNVAYLLPHGAVRMAAMGMEQRAATEAEMLRMKQSVALGMQEGAFGLSTGLTYAPCSYSDKRELTALCEVVAKKGGFFAPHIRNYAATMAEAVEEVVEIAAATKVPLHLTHFHASFSANQGKASRLLELVNKARQEGLDVTMDSYPYLAGSTFLSGVLPAWAHDGGPSQLVERLKDRNVREKLRVVMEETGSDGLHNVPIDWATIFITGVSSEKNSDLIGLSVKDGSTLRRKTPIDYFCDLLVDENLEASCIIFIGNEENVREIMKHPAHMVGSDGLLVGARPHPRAYGTHARYLSVYVRELGILTLEDCIRKMTSLPAQRLGLQDRGVIKEGMAADLVIFDPDNVRDTATYENPKNYPTGIPYVLVNGNVIKDAGEHTGILAGRALRKRIT